MNIVYIVEGIERLVVSLLFWIIFIPKSIYKIVTDPKWVEVYVTKELKEETDRFRDYMSPIILYLLNSVFLVFVYIFIKRDILKDISSSYSPDTTTIWDMVVSGLDISGDMITTLSGSYGFVAAAVFLSFPLFFALVIELAKRKELSREELRRTTYIQCYYFSPLALCFSLIILSSSLLKEMEQNLIVINFLFFFIWFSITETRFIARELRKRVLMSAVVYVAIFLGVITGTYGVISVFNVFDEDRNKFEKDSEPIEFAEPQKKGTYEVIVHCPECPRTATDSLYFDRVLTWSKGGGFDSKEIAVPRIKKSSTKDMINGSFKTIDFDLSESKVKDLYIDVLDEEGYSIIGGIKSRQAMIIRRLISYLLLTILAITVFTGLRSLIKKDYIK